MIPLDFWQNLIFSSANEDGETECRALAGARRRRGDRTGREPGPECAAGPEDRRNRTVRPRSGAGVLGIADSRSRRQQDQGLRPRLDRAAQQYWDNHLRQIDQVVWRAGKWEKLLWWNARFLRLFRGRSVDMLMDAPTLADQDRIWRERFDTVVQHHDTFICTECLAASHRGRPRRTASFPCLRTCTAFSTTCRPPPDGETNNSRPPPSGNFRGFPDGSGFALRHAASVKGT